MSSFSPFFLSQDTWGVMIFLTTRIPKGGRLWLTVFKASIPSWVSLTSHPIVFYKKDCEYINTACTFGILAVFHLPNNSILWWCKYCLCATILLLVITWWRDRCSSNWKLGHFIEILTRVLLLYLLSSHVELVLCFEEGLAFQWGELQSPPSWAKSLHLGDRGQTDMFSLCIWA